VEQKNPPAVYTFASVVSTRFNNKIFLKKIRPSHRSRPKILGGYPIRFGSGTSKPAIFEISGGRGNRSRACWQECQRLNDRSQQDFPRALGTSGGVARGCWSTSSADQAGAPTIAKMMMTRLRRILIADTAISAARQPCVASRVTASAEAPSIGGRPSAWLWGIPACLRCRRRANVRDRRSTQGRSAAIPAFFVSVRWRLVRRAPQTLRASRNKLEPRPALWI
jgi:hypothetical protein